MKKYLLIILFAAGTFHMSLAQTLQTVVDNGNTVTSPVRFNGRAHFGESYDAGAYGMVQITRPANQGGQFHLSFIRQGQMVYGMGFLNNSSVFGIQPGADNSGSNGVFISPEGKVGIGTSSPASLTEIKRTFPSGSPGMDFLRLTSSQAGAWFSQLGLQFRWEDTGNQTAFNLAQITAMPIWPGGTQSGGDLQFWTKSTNVSPESELTEKMRITASGNVGIGTVDPKGYKLAVAGNMIAESVKVKLQGAWPDYVFLPSYKVPTLQEIEKHIKEKGHLPGIPSASEVKANGVDLGDMNAKLLQKIEELTLHLIRQEKEMQVMKKDNETQSKKLQTEINDLKLKLK